MFDSNRGKDLAYRDFLQSNFGSTISPEGIHSPHRNIKVHSRSMHQIYRHLSSDSSRSFAGTGPDAPGTLCRTSSPGGEPVLLRGGRISGCSAAAFRAEPPEGPQGEEGGRPICGHASGSELAGQPSLEQAQVMPLLHPFHFLV